MCVIGGEGKALSNGKVWKRRKLPSIKKYKEYSLSHLPRAPQRSSSLFASHYLQPTDRRVCLKGNALREMVSSLHSLLWSTLCNRC